MEMELNDKHLTMLLAAIGQKLSNSEEMEYGPNLACVASFATKLITTVIVGHADNREEALEGVRSALADCEIMVNKAYDVLEPFMAMRERKAH
jgi:hypothetical protein